MVLGFLSHLVLDEIYSIEWRHGRLRLKSSFGTALKLLGHSRWANVSAFAKLALLTGVIFLEPRWGAIKPTLSQGSVQETATHLIDGILKR